MRMIALASVAALALSGCQLTDNQMAAYKAACAALDAAHQVYKDNHEGATSRPVAAAYEIANRACINPPTDIITATTQILLAAYTIKRAA
jgi:hypothetical protein